MTSVLSSYLPFCRLASRFFSLDEQRQSPVLAGIEAGREGRSRMPLDERRVLDKLNLQACMLQDIHIDAISLYSKIHIRSVECVHLGLGIRVAYEHLVFLRMS